MMAGKELRIYFLITLSAFTLLNCATSTQDIDGICHHWGDIAKQMTGGERIQNCTSPDTSECGRLDCIGIATLRNLPVPAAFKKIIEIDYCFGIELRSCNDPQAIDFYLQVPNQNFTDTVRFSEDTEYPMDDLRYNVGSFGYLYPDFTFTYEKQNDSSIEFSIIANIKARPFFGGSYYVGISLTLIKEEKVYPLPCDKTTKDPNKKPPSDFIGSKCVPGIFVPDITPRPKSYTPSGTLYKECDTVMSPCGNMEMCDFSRQPHICICNPEAQLSPKNDSCLSSSRLNKPCRQHSDCDYFNEECVAGPAHTATCQCFHGFEYDVHRGMCTLSGKSPDVGPAVSTPTPSHMSTPQPHSPPQPRGGSASHNQPEDFRDVAAEGKHNLPIYIGAGVASVVVIGLLAWGVVYLIRKRRRQAATDSVSRLPMLGNDDGDDNLIM